MTSEHDFGKYPSQEEWDQVVFDNAIRFTAFEFGVGRWEFMTFADAVLKAIERPRCVIYAITASGRSTCLPKSMWQSLLTNTKQAQKTRKKGPCDICNRSDGKMMTIKDRLVHASCWRTERLK